MAGLDRPALLRAVVNCLTLLMLGAHPALIAAKPMRSSLAMDVADITERACFASVSGSISFNRTPKADLKAEAKLMESLGLVSGLNNKTLTLLGAGGGGLIDSAIIAERANGEARIVLAIGGRVPGCRTILATKDAGKAETELTSLLQTNAYGWKSLPSKNATRGNVRKLSFIRRDASGKPYLLNMLIPSATNTDVKLLTTVHTIPPKVTLPAGF